MKLVELVTTPATSPLSMNDMEESIKFRSVEVAIIFLGLPGPICKISGGTSE